MRLSNYTKYGELSEQRIKYEILNDENSFFNMLEYSAAIFTVGEDYTSILNNLLQNLSGSQLIQNTKCQNLLKREKMSGLNRAIILKYN